MLSLVIESGQVLSILALLSFISVMLIINQSAARKKIRREELISGEENLPGIFSSNDEDGSRKELMEALGLPPEGLPPAILKKKETLMASKRQPSFPLHPLHGSVSVQSPDLDENSLPFSVSAA